MGSKGEKENVLKYKLLYSGIIILVYIIGKNISLYGIDTSAFINPVHQRRLFQNFDICAWNFSFYDIQISGSDFYGGQRLIHQNQNFLEEIPVYDNCSHSYDRRVSGGCPGSGVEV